MEIQTDDQVERSLNQAASHHPHTENYLNIEVFPGGETESVSTYAQFNQRSSPLFYLPRENVLRTKLILDPSN